MLGQEEERALRLRLRLRGARAHLSLDPSLAWQATSIAAYTANLASFMVQKQEDAGMVTGLNDIVMRGKSLCVVPDVANMITEPGILERVVMVESGFMGSMFEMLLLGLCDAALVGKMEYMLYAQVSFL